ncbi:6-phosphogluconolactonase [Planctomycetes bacterium CA13]|uniref:6-phosphogluconolactonase n=1 Tax=Novipirellula herctigrandis TaxID=2527986 RepID=A0A5C5Z077_9BACT|nr:6-phosphogluconolactonase [Planctomycetes bacterium CA13]
MMKPYIQLTDLHQAATDAFCDLANQCIASNGLFRVSLSGGSTPKRLYEMIAQRDLDWTRIHWFWGDERNVPSDSPDSNFKMVREAILDKRKVPQANIHNVPVNVDDPASAALAYERTLREHFSDQPMPAWDLVLLGMGDDAHTASLFPRTKAIDESSRWFVENWVEKFDAFRYTLTAPAINSGKEIWFLVAGDSKKTALANVFSENQRPNEYPSQLIRPTRWFVTQDACPDSLVR